MRDTPYIHLFRTSQSYYLYDVNMDQILNIPETFYSEMKGHITSGLPIAESKRYMEKLQSFGYLKPNRVRIVKHPATDLLPYLVKRKLSQMVLQITQRCNLRCEYCIYSGAYSTRTHSQKDMEWPLAKKAMEYLITHSVDNESITLSFYGGEPLLRFDLIQKCVRYMSENVKGKLVSYNFTTNGTIMTPEIADFCVKHNFGIMFSLDGPKELHDQHRKFAHSPNGSFDLLRRTVKLFEDKYPEYAKSFQFNTVIDVERPYKPVSDFINHDPEFGKYSSLINTIDDVYTSRKRSSAESFSQLSEYEYFEYLLTRAGRHQPNFGSKLAAQRYRDIPEKILRHRDKSGFVPERYHHGGPCVPGVRKAFVTVQGEIYPWERVSETSSLTKLGDVYSGIDIDKAERVLNIERLTHETCSNCWAYRYCNLCIKAVDGISCFDTESLKARCKNVRNNIESVFKDYCVLKELGFDFYKDKCGEIEWLEG